MSATTQEKIVQLEKDANELVNNLDLLYKKAGSYNTAKDELQKTNTELVKLIQETKTLGEESHKIIAKINEIGSGQIFKQLEKIDRGIVNLDSDTKNGLIKNKSLIITAIAVSVISFIISILIFIK